MKRRNIIPFFTLIVLVIGTLLAIFLYDDIKHVNKHCLQWETKTVNEKVCTDHYMGGMCSNYVYRKYTHPVCLKLDQ